MSAVISPGGVGSDSGGSGSGRAGPPPHRHGDRPAAADDVDAAGRQVLLGEQSEERGAGVRARVVVGEEPAHQRVLDEGSGQQRAGLDGGQVVHGCTSASDAGGAVDPLADQVGVAVVPGVLLDQVDQDAAQRVLVARRRSTPVTSRDGAAASMPRRDQRSRPARRRRPPRGAGVGRVVGDLEVPVRRPTSGTSCPSRTRRNQARSTSAMCRTRPSSVRDDGVVRRRRSSSDSPAHFSARVSRWKSR